MVPRNGGKRPGMILLLCALLFLGRPEALRAETADALTLWIHPYLPATELVARFSPLTDYLTGHLGRPVNIRVQQSYQAHLDFVGRNQADLAFMGPATYVTMRRHHGDKPLLAMLTERDSPFFHGMIIVRRDSPRRSIGDLKSASFAFGDPNSTMSHLVPRAMLHQAGLQVTDLSRYDFLNSHQDVALAVLGGFFEAGAVKDEVYAEYEQRGLRALAVTPPVPDHLFLTRSNLDPQLVARLRHLLLALNDNPAGRQILQTIKPGPTGLAPAASEDYDSLAAMLEGVDFD